VRAPPRPRTRGNRHHETIPGDTREFLAPDLPLEPSSADYFANRDPLLELMLAGSDLLLPGLRA
jgi:hypothetical protein